MKKIKLTRHKGTFNYIDAMIVIFTMGFCAVVFVYFVLPIINRGKAESIARQYIIKGQQQGELLDTDIASMTRDLQDKGCKNIRIRTIGDKVKYGEDIDLIIEYDIEVKDFKIDKNSVFPTFEVQTKKIIIDKSTISTAT